MKENKNKQLEDKCRALFNPCNRALAQAFTYYLQGELNNCSLEDIITSMELLRDIKILLGYKEDKIQEGTTVKNYKLFDDEGD